MTEEQRDVTATGTVEERLRAIEDRLAIYQIVSGYGYAIDGCNAVVVGSLYAPDGVYAVGDVGSFEGREQIEAIAASPHHLSLVDAGRARVDAAPRRHQRRLGGGHLPHHGRTAWREGFFVGRLSASRIELSRTGEGLGWQIDHRQNYLQEGDGKGPALLARLHEPPAGRFF